ncbi:MAG: MauE/DoxX family redox-associated membrane protein [Gaiellales bacterium]
MPEFELPLPYALGLVFLVAGAGKLARREHWRGALAGYRGVPLRRAVAWLVPLSELAVGAALVAGLDAAGWAAAGLVAAFTGVLAAELLAGARPPACGCLWPSAGPPGPLSLARNALLAGAGVAVAGNVHLVTGRGFWLAAFALLWLVVAALTALVLALYRQVGVLHQRLGPRGAFEHDAESLALGSPAPDGLRHALVVFTSATCSICRQIAPGVRALSGEPGLTVIEARVEEASGARLHEAFAVPGTPYAVYVDGGGLVRAKGGVENLEQLDGLLATGRAREREGVLGHAA